MSKCHCLIKHARTPKERETVRQGLEYARSIQDNIGIAISLAQLAPCKSDPVTPECNQPGYSNR
jgi:hypothetical protein